MTKPNKTGDTIGQKYFFPIMTLTIVFWAMAFPFIKIGLTELSPVNLTIMRLALVCVVFLGLRLFIPQGFTKLEKKDIPSVFLLGFFGVIVYHLGLNYGEQYISASAASLIIATIPLFVVILAAFYLKERITLRIIMGVILSLTGVVIISIASRPDAVIEITYLSGAFAVLIAAIVGAIYVVIGKKMLQRYSALSLTVYAFLFGSLGLLPFVTPSLFEEVAVLTWNGWSAVIFLALCSTVVAYVLWYVALETRQASELSVYLYFIPVLSTIISFIFFHEHITILFLVGGVLVILGLIIVNKKKK